MLSEHFVDICISLCCSVNSTFRQHKDLFNNIKVIIDWYYREVKEDSRPIEFKDKTDLLKWLCEYRQSGGSNDVDVINAKLSSGRLHDISQILPDMKQELTDDTIYEKFKVILNRRKLCEVIKGKGNLQQLLSDIDNCSLIDDEEVLQKWEDQLGKAHKSLMQIKKVEMLEETSSLDVMNDDYEPMFNQIIQSMDDSNIVQTGFQYLKKKLVCGGFESRRLYLVGGTSGVGKSALLINLICNAIKERAVTQDNEPVTYLYITAENLIDETWIRFYCCLTGKIHGNFMQTIRKIRIACAFDPEATLIKIKEFYTNVKKQIYDVLKARNANVIIKYVQAHSTTCDGIVSIVDTISAECNLRALYFDYLDLLCSGKNTERRFELEEITQSLKNIGINYNIPVITVTQLNRDGYKADAAPALTQMSESMGKVNAADLVLLLQEDVVKNIEEDGISYKVLKMTILKQRNGPQGESVQLYLPLSRRNGDSIFNFRFTESKDISYEKQKETITSFPLITTNQSMNNIEPVEIVEQNETTDYNVLREDSMNEDFWCDGLSIPTVVKSNSPLEKLLRNI